MNCMKSYVKRATNLIFGDKKCCSVIFTMEPTEFFSFDFLEIFSKKIDFCKMPTQGLTGAMFWAAAARCTSSEEILRGICGADIGCTHPDLTSVQICSKLI